MRETLDNAARRKATELGKKHNIADIGRLTSIVKRIVTEAREVAFDKIRSHDDPLQGAWVFINSLDNALSFLPSNSAMDLFEHTDSTMLTKFDEIVKQWFGGVDPFYTHKELSHLIAEFIRFLKDSKGPVVLTGLPLKRFAASSWFDQKLTQLYPLRIPSSLRNTDFLRGIVAQRRTKRQEQTKQFVYTWFAVCDIRRPLPSLHPARKMPWYESDPLMYSFRDEEVEQIEESRMKLFNLKLAVLETANTNITRRTVGAIDNGGFWKECMAAISNKLSRQEFRFLRNMERKYLNLRFLSLLSEELDLELGEPTDEIRETLRTGGISDLFDFILFIEQELRTDQMHNAKTQMTQLLGDKKPRSYYQLVLSPNTTKIDGIIMEWLEGYVKNEEFHKVFCRRLEKDIKKQLEVSVCTTSQRYEAIRAYDQFLEKHHGIGIEVIGRLAEPLDIKRQIYPIKLPPGTRWEDITIRFLDGESLQIKAKELSTKATYQDLGLVDYKSNLKPNKQWQFFYDLSKLHGKLTWKDPQATRKVKKKKSLLSKTLREYFQLQEDPFYPYRQVKAYKTKFKLIPEPGEEYTSKPEDDFGDFTDDSLDYSFQ